MVRSIFYVWKNILKFAFHFIIVEGNINTFLKPCIGFIQIKIFRWKTDEICEFWKMSKSLI